MTSLPSAAMDTIFVSIAAYRDPDLVATIDDCLAKAARPDRLHFGICWQHAPDERLPDRLDDPRFRKLDVDARDSQGACWARAQTMSLFGDEDWYLQLDSHHRFIQDWDTRLIDQAALTESPRPLLTTYAAAFSHGQEPNAREQVTQLDFDRFTDEGIILTKPRLIVEPPPTPIPARFVSAHFLLAPGRFVNDVSYDPELYFTGEEITLAIRAFSHGYDLFHPAKHILWHEYTRAYRPLHWEDHTAASGAGLAWGQRNSASLAKISRFLAIPEVGRHSLGTARTFDEYEAYAGVSFRSRACRITPGLAMCRQTRLPLRVGPSACVITTSRCGSTPPSCRLLPSRTRPCGTSASTTAQATRSIVTTRRVPNLPGLQRLTGTM